MSDSSVCWACGADIDKGIAECPSCGMPLEEDEEEEDLSFLDDMSKESERKNDESVDMPDMEYTEGKKEITSTQPGEIDQEVESEEVESGTSTDEPSDLELDEDGLPMMPDIDDFSEIIDEEVEEEEKEIVAPNTLWSLGPISIMKLFATQWTYWTIIFFIISISSYEITDPNISYYNLQANDFLIHADAFIFGWLSFIPMGWFFAYKLKQNRVPVKSYYLIAFLIGQYLWMNLIMYIPIIMLNPQILDGVYNPINYVFTGILQFTYQNFIYAGFTAGFIVFYVCATNLWDTIYQFTPMYKSNPQLSQI